MSQRVWTCQRQANGRKCGHVNPARKQLCQSCGKHKPPRREPAHRAILGEMDYAACVALFGERCGICGCAPKPGRKLHRDHDHRTGELRGLLCFRDNSALRSYMTLGWLRTAVAYLERHEAGKRDAA